MKTIIYRGKEYEVIGSFPSIHNGSKELLLKGHGKIFVAPAGQCKGGKS